MALNQIATERYFFVAIFILGILLFYWFSYSPRQVRAHCIAEAEFTPTATLMSNEAERQNFIDEYYQNCIRRFGLKD